MGLYEGFEGYRTATRDQLREALRSWMVVLDTNVLLSLYSYQGASLDDFTKVFEALEDRLFVPHQVIDEFWRNRRTVLNENRGRHRERETVEKAFAEIDSALRRWHQRVVDRAQQPPPQVLRELREGRTAVLNYMDQKNAEARIVGPDTSTQNDHVLQRLEKLLDGRVGPPPERSELTRLHQEGMDRVKRRVPPGYQDAEKAPERAIGDFLVWRETMEEARRRSSPVLFVTQDQKEDWWADRGTAAMRARPELVAELLEFAAQPLLLIRSHDLLSISDVLGVQVSQATVADAEEALEELEAKESNRGSGVGLLYREFWTRFEILAKERHWTTATPPSANWWSMPAGGGGNTWSVSYAQFGCRSELYFGHADRAVNLHRFILLKDRSEEIQEAFGDDQEVHFDDLPHAVGCRIECRLEDGRKISDRNLWSDSLDWLVDTQERLRAAIAAVGGVPLSLPD